MKPILTGIVAAASAVALTASAQEASTQREQASVSQAATEPYQPSLSEIMARQQMRHIKLWFSGRGGNWLLADYEVDALKGGFDQVSDLLGGNTVESAVGAALSALEKAVDAKNRAAFTSAFDQLTAGCNNCHRTLDHGFIAIRRPSLSGLPYSDQFLAPK